MLLFIEKDHQQISYCQHKFNYSCYCIGLERCRLGPHWCIGGASDSRRHLEWGHFQFQHTGWGHHKWRNCKWRLKDIQFSFTKSGCPSNICLCARVINAKGVTDASQMSLPTKTHHSRRRGSQTFHKHPDFTSLYWLKKKRLVLAPYIEWTTTQHECRHYDVKQWKTALKLFSCKSNWKPTIILK